MAVVIIFVSRNNEGKESPEIISVTPDILEELNKQTPGITKIELETAVEIGKLAPDFQTQTYDGKNVRLSDFRGKKPVFLNFWAGWCPFCVEEMPLMAQVQEKFQNQYITLAVNRAESLKTAKKFSDQVGVTNRLLVILDLDDNVYRLFNGFAMPYSIFIDKGGVIRDIKLGPLQQEELEEKIKKIL